MFHESTVFQERNEHDLLHDFRDEIPGYLNNAQLCQALSELELRGGVEYLADDLKICYELLIKLGYIGAEEMPLVDAWLEDVSSLI